MLDCLKTNFVSYFSIIVISILELFNFYLCPKGWYRIFILEITMTVTMTGKTKYNAPTLAFLLLDYFDLRGCGTGLFSGGRFYCWTFLKWEILLLDFFEVGDSDAGLFS